MAAPYSKERKIEILTYARDNGVKAASRHFNVPHVTITRWNRELKIYTPQTHQYPIEKRRAVLNYVVRHNIKAAVEHFGVSRGIIERWNKELKVYKSPQRKFTDEQKLEILYYARDNGVFRAMDRYDISNKTIVMWNKKFHVYQEQKQYTPDERKRILMFARDNGLVAAEQEFNVTANTMLRWNKEYKIYTPRQIPDYVRYSVSEQMEFLNQAKQLYYELPDNVRSANLVFQELASKHPVTVDQLTAWNKKYKIVPRRTYRAAPLSQADISAAQAALTAARGRVMRAARASGISKNTIAKLKKDKTISFEQATTKIRTNLPIGRRKAGAIATIIQMLQWNAQNQAKK